MKGKPVSVARLIQYNFPSDWAGPDAGDSPEVIRNSLSLKVGDFVACEPQISPLNKKVFVSKVERIHSDQDLVQVTLYHVPATSRFGPWQRRPWEVWQENGNIHSELVTIAEIICKVTLQNSALTQNSLETLAKYGVDTGTQPRRDSHLPRRH